jgi:hypothetical protein
MIFPAILSFKTISENVLIKNFSLTFSQKKRNFFPSKGFSTGS